MDEMERNKGLLILKNKQLWQGIQTLSERQTVLEKFLEEQHILKQVERFKKNKERMVYALKIPKAEVNAAVWEGKRSSNYKRMLRIVKVANDHWKIYKAIAKKESRSSTRKKHQNTFKRKCDDANPTELEELGLKVEFGRGVIIRKRLNCCLECVDDSHTSNFKCSHPLRLVEDGVTETPALVEARIQKLRDIYKDDPLVSYAQRNFLRKLSSQSRSRFRKRAQPDVRLEKVKKEQPTGISEGMSESEQQESIFTSVFTSDEEATKSDNEEQITEDETNLASASI